MLEVFKVWNDSHPLVGVLLLLMLVDIGSGLVVAWNEHNINSTKMREGIVKKFGIILTLVVCIILDPYDGGLALTDYGAGLFNAAELLSIFENLKKLGVPGLDSLASRLKIFQPPPEPPILPVVVVATVAQAPQHTTTTTMMTTTMTTDNGGQTDQTQAETNPTS